MTAEEFKFRRKYKDRDGIDHTVWIVGRRKQDEKTDHRCLQRLEIFVSFGSQRDVVCFIVLSLYRKERT